MSTRQSYQINLAEVARRRAALELSRRSLHLANLKAARVQSELHQTAEQLRQIRTDGLNQRVDELERDLARHRQALASCREEIAGAKAQLNQEMAALKEVACDVARERELLVQAMAQAEQTLDQIDRLSQLNLAGAEDLARAARETSQLAGKQIQLEQEIAAVERAVRFVSLKAELAPAAMTTLMCMEANGYQLGETDSRDMLTFYFQKAERDHQIAVRLAPVKEDGATWDLLAETFEMQGTECLEELDDFETAMEDLELGRLVRGDFRVYPKDDRDPPQRVWGKIPKPVKQPLRRTRREAGKQYER